MANCNSQIWQNFELKWLRSDSILDHVLHLLSDRNNPRNFSEENTITPSKAVTDTQICQGF